MADENFNARIVSGVRRAVSAIDLVTVQEAGLRGTPDPELLGWAAADDRVVITHDENTMIAFAIARTASGAPMAGLIVVRDGAPVGEIIEALVLWAECGIPGELEGQVLYLPW